MPMHRRYALSLVLLLALLAAGCGFRLQGASVLPAGLERVHVVNDCDTSFTPYDWQTVASRITWMISTLSKMPITIDSRARMMMAISRAMVSPNTVAIQHLHPGG